MRILRDTAKRLRVWWSARENDFMIWSPNSPDGHMMNDVMRHCRGIGGRTFIEELEARGYDVKTLRISCWRKDSLIK